MGERSVRHLVQFLKDRNMPNRALLNQYSAKLEVGLDIRLIFRIVFIEFVKSDELRNYWL